jgi:hypothetical protein
MVQAVLGLEIDGRRRQVTLRAPRLPANLEWLKLAGLGVAGAEVDLLCERRGDDVGISVAARRGDVKVVTEN